MTREKPRLANADIATIVVAGSCGIFVANLTLLVASLNSDLLTELLLKPMWPGLYLGYILTGRSDGSAAQQEAAPWIAAVINAVVYFAVVVALRLMWRHLTRAAPDESKEPNSEEAA
jgi:hypothetical protein